MTDEKHDGLQAVLEAGRLIGAAEHLAALELEVPHALVPGGCKLESLEKTLQRPLRKDGCPRFIHERGFTAYVNEQKDAASRLYADLEAASMTAVLNHHEVFDGDRGRQGARWGDHRALFAPPKDPDWLTWTGKNDAPMDQMSFAQFVEDNLPAIVAPDGAELLELAQHLESTTKVDFKSAERLAGGGRSFAYEEQAQNRLGKGKVSLPEEFALSLPVFVKGDKVSLTAKLRYLIKEGSLLLWYHLHRPQDALDDAFQRLSDGGRSFAYEQEVQKRLGKGTVELPEEFALSLAVFVKGDKVSLTAKLRYRLKEGSLLLWYHLHRPQDALDDAFQRLLDGVAVETGLTPWPGTPG